jgi:hypothetical protein
MWENDDDADENDYDPEQERKRMEALPIFQKAEEIRELTRRIIDSIDNEEVRMIHSNIMLEDSIILSSKIAGAEAMDDFIMKMENATIIKIHARSLLTQHRCSSKKCFRKNTCVYYEKRSKHFASCFATGSKRFTSLRKKAMDGDCL